MLVNVDAKYLDWLAAAYLSQDSVAMQEIWSGFDLHTDNQKVFGLPSRLIAKVFLFRIIFGGSAYSFAKDPDFDECKFNVKQWEGVIERFYRKYKGVHKWHQTIIREATTKGFLVIPTGRRWDFEMVKNYKGELEWPITKIKNFVVQGLEADLMTIARVSLYNRIKNDRNLLIINTVHDSIILDVPKDMVEYTVKTIASVFRDVPKNFERLFGQEFNLPFRGEIQIGMDWKNMNTVDADFG